MNPTHDYINCDVCNKIITDYNNDFFHMSAILSTTMQFSTHYHLCKECFTYNNKTIPILSIKGQQMNKNLIKKYFKEFNHWLSGVSLLYRKKDWVNPNAWTWDDSFWDKPEHTDLSSYNCIINDEYSEFRKALCYGKTVQVNRASSYDEDSTVLDSDGNYWCDIEIESFPLQPYCYRIKPDESKFKVGDYVRIHFSTGESKVVQCTKAPEEPGQVSFIDCDGQLHTTTGCDCRLWKPQPQELCYFWDNEDMNEYVVVSRYYSTDHNGNYIAISGGAYDNIAPFVGTPPNIK